MTGSNQHVVPIRARHAQHYNATNVEKHYPPKSPKDSPRNLFFHIWCFTKGRTHDLGPDVSKASLDEGGPKSKKTSETAVRKVFAERSWVLPIVESDNAATFDGLERCHKTGDDEHGHDYQLNHASNVLALSEDTDMEEVDDDHRERKDGDPDTNVELWTPVLDDDACGCEVVGENDNVLAEVIVARCEANELSVHCAQTSMATSGMSRRVLTPELGLRILLHSPGTLCPSSRRLPFLPVLS